MADGAWRVRGGPLGMFNAYLVESTSGVVVFDTGIAEMAPVIHEAAEKLGGIERVVLGHGHVDHRGSAALLGADVYCHPADREDAAGDAGRRYVNRARLPETMQQVADQLWPQWDAGPVAIAGIINEGERIADFEVLSCPGHAPGHITLWRERDRVALVSDAFYAVDIETMKHVPPRLPHPGLNLDSEAASESLTRLAEREPASAWPGHGEPATGDVARLLREAARRENRAP